MYRQEHDIINRKPTFIEAIIIHVAIHIDVFSSSEW